MEYRKIFLIITAFCTVLATIGLAYAQVNIGESPDETHGVVIPAPEEIVTPFDGNATYANDSNYSLFSNSSDFWDDLDTPADIEISDLGDVDITAGGDGDFLQLQGLAFPFDVGTYDLFGGANDWTARNTFDDLEISDGNWATWKGSFAETRVQDQFLFSAATIDLPKSTSTISANQVADTISTADSFTATSVSLYVAEDIEHVGDRDNVIGFPATNEQEFCLDTSACYLAGDRLGGKTNIHWTVYGMDITAGAGDVIIDDGDLRVYEHVALNYSTGNPEHPVDMGGHYNARDQYFYAYDNVGGQTLGASWVHINFSEVVRQDNIFPSFDTSNVSVDLGGADDVFWYRIEADFSSDVSVGSGRSTSVFRLMKNNAEIDGSRCWIYNRVTSQGEGSCSSQVMVELSNGDTIRAEGMRNAGTDTIVTIADGSRFYVQKA